ncbi:related to aldehyde reductase II [Rhynchosporium secalis]|uniref:Related to aldehyde reductase II n=1 Tax=Rhynchosporium secalis TaxID=38038 RepID=A0A1E1LZA0_RHYSE|nr:related to aldehyde reductase II [Rhynchosporium secalis]
MAKVLLTGIGFIAAHVLDILLQHGHTVITTVRSQAKADKIASAHPSAGSNLSFKIVEDIAVEGAFDEAVKIDGLEAVIHTASPFHFNVTDTKKDLLDPAIIGTKGLLSAIKKNAPSVKRVVITSSFASIVDAGKGLAAGYTYSEKDWNPVTEEQATKDPSTGYRASKTFAEKAAWNFVEKEKPNFTIATMCPPLVLGPIVHYLNDLDALNTSNQRVRNLITGQCKEEIPDTGTYLWTDVRDLALGHVKAMELPEAGGKRFFFTAGYFSNKEICEIIRKNFPEYKDQLPAESVKGGDYPEGGIYKYDNKRSTEVLGVKWTGLESSIVDLVKSLKDVGA